MSKLGKELIQAIEKDRYSFDHVDFSNSHYHENDIIYFLETLAKEPENIRSKIRGITINCLYNFSSLLPRMAKALAQNNNIKYLDFSLCI